MNHERRIAQSLIAAGATVFLAMGSLGWLRLAGLAVIALAFYIWKARQEGLIAGSILAALAVYRLLGGFGTLLISLAVSGFVIAKLEPNQRRWARSVALASAGAVVLLAFEALALLTSAWFAVLLVAVGAYMLYVEQQSGQWVTLDTLRDIAKERVYGSHIDSNAQAPSKQKEPATASTASAQPSTVPTEQPATSTEQTSAQTEPTISEKPATNIDAANMPEASIDHEDAAAAEAVNAGDTTPNTTPNTTTSTAPNTTTSTANESASSPETQEIPAAEPIPAANGYAALLEDLFAWRDQAADSYDRAPGQVLRDDILEEIANVKPQTLDALGEIRGIGSKKLERYGADILKVLREHDSK